MLSYRIAGLLLCALFLVSCAELPSSSDGASPKKSELLAFSLEARFSLRHEDTNYSGHLSWRHDGMNNELLLVSPFGQGIAEIVTSASGARLTTNDGKVYSEANAETLTRRVLGYTLPLEKLTDWVRGKDLADGIVERDDQGRPLRLRQEDWSVDYGYASDVPDAVPDRIFAERTGGFELRLIIDEWSSLPPTDRKP